MAAFSEYAEHDATGLAALIRDGEVTPTEVVEAALGRAEALQDRLNCFVGIDAEGARASAATAVDGPFRGVPFAVKDFLGSTGRAPHGGGQPAGYTGAIATNRTHRWPPPSGLPAW
ncbi:MAG: hypothetical protein U5R48_16795 [Gammaproteobacteria bacterium]|nr:hypothetical protein [Gammaproteobacteria bacterium]